MSFVSWGYFLFLACTLIIYYIFPHRFRWIVLLAASLVFCLLINVYSTAWLAATIVLTYCAAYAIARCTERGRRRGAKAILACSLVLLFGSLLVLKYLPLLFKKDLPLLLTKYLPPAARSLLARYSAASIANSIVMPVGISFYLFQVTGYLIDLYGQKTALVRHFGHYSLAVSFFAKLSQGPITPVAKLVSRFAEPVEIDPLKMRRGAVRILIGLVKKAVIADRLAVVANNVFADPSGVNAAGAAIGAVFYTLQLYADFAGYTDVAIGSAQLFGIELPENFRQPYLARSIAEFWRRWHITLSDWLKNYVYIPLGGSRVSRGRWAFNILTVFLISGVWHGSGLTFIVWGLLHGCYQVAGKMTSGPRTAVAARFPRGAKRLTDRLSVIVTFVLVSIAWIFFRADSMGTAMEMLARLACGDWTFSLQQLAVEANEWWLSCVLIVLMVIADLISERRPLLDLIEERALPVRWLIYLALLYLLIFFGIYGAVSAQSFIYVSF